MGFVDMLGIRFEELSSARVTASMLVGDHVLQPYGYLHGGATISLLETLASQGAVLSCADGQLPFAVDVHVAHRASARAGTVYASACLDGETLTSKGYAKQTWAVEARDEAGTTLSEGTVICLIVPEAER